jgi:2-oxoglutarate ferredoxin oxidoreductase subunit beta
VRVGADKLVARGDSGELVVVEAEGADMSRVVTHDAGADDPSLAFQLSRLDDPKMAHVPMGIFRNVSRPTYDDLVRGQIDGAISTAGGAPTDADLATLLHGKDTWTVADEPIADVP